MIKKCLQLGFVLIGCSSLFAQTEKPSEIFWKNLEKHCGKAYEGKLPEHITRDDFAGKKLTSSLIALISSTPLFDAASISTTSGSDPSNIPLQISHSLQGSPFFGFKQLIALARILAAEVLPDPFGPENKNDWGISSADKNFFNLSATSDKSKSDSLFGRYFK